MTSHEIARMLLTMPDKEFTASIDVARGGFDRESVMKVYGYLPMEVIENETYVTVLFEDGYDFGESV